MEAKYLQVKNYLLNLFQREKFETGRRIPTEFELMDQLDVSRNTVRKAVQELEAEGVVSRKHGSGTFFVSMNQEKSEERGGLIGLGNFYFMDYIYPEIIRGIEDTLFDEGYSLVLANCNQDYSRELSSLQRLVDQGIKGLILEPSRNFLIDREHPITRMLENLQIPIVATHWGKNNANISTVTINDELAGYQATRHFLDKGHSKIGIVYKSDVQAARLRYNGYCRALEEAGIPLPSDRIVSYDDAKEAEDTDQGYFCTKELLQQAPDTTAIFYFNDNIALQGYEALRELNLDIPGDISVIGFDNYHNTHLVHPPLTTFEHPKYNLGKWAAKILIDEIEQGERLHPMELIFEPVLVERQSVKDLTIEK
ncbi:MAG: GntR family transcriptional regulator [Spirochaetales bacterium]|nr:GntR family transcriptional regulator [Spirochaetales bacterium]